MTPPHKIIIASKAYDNDVNENESEESKNPLESQPDRRREKARP